jgi:hypothetical protein
MGRNNAGRKRLMATGSFAAFGVAVALGQATPASAAAATTTQAATAQASTAQATTGQAPIARALAHCSHCKVSVRDAARSEARSGARDRGLMSFRVQLNVPAPSDIHVRYTTVNGAGATGAVAGSDYGSRSGWVRIAAGRSSALVPVLIHNDTRWEFTERFRLVLTAATHGATIVDRSGTGTIYDNDRAFVSVRDAGPVSEGAGPLSFAVRLSRPLPFPVWVRTTTANLTATAGQDYVGSSTWVKFNPGQVVKHRLVPVIDDSGVEGTERMRLLLSNPTGGPGVGLGVRDGLGYGTILNDDVIH